MKIMLRYGYERKVERGKIEEEGKMEKIIKKRIVIIVMEEKIGR